MSANLSGGCLCGQIRYELSVRPQHVGDCHCIDCRRSSGAPFVTWGSVSRSHFKWVGAASKRIAFAGRWRSFAPCCGTALLFEDTEDSETVDVTIASLDDPAPFPPAKSIWLEDHLPWVLLNRSIPQFQRSSRDG